MRRDQLQLRVTGAATKGQAQMVSAVGTTPDRSTSYAIDYTVEGSRVVDLSIDGVSLVQGWRSQISSLLRRKKLDELKSKLRARIATAPQSQPSSTGPPMSEAAATVLVVGLAIAGAYLVTCGVVQYFGARPTLCR